MWRYGLTLAVLLAMASTALCGTPVDPEVLNALNRHYATVTGFAADYRQETVTQTMGGPQPITMKEYAEGKIYFKRPNLFVVDQKEPRPELVIANQEYTWWVIPEENKAYRYPPQSRSGVIKALDGLLSGKEKLEEFFQISLLDSTKDSMTLQMVPRQPNDDFQRLEVKMAKQDFKLISMKVYYPLGQEVLFKFESVQENQTLPNDFFEFTPPPGVRVITH